MNSLTTSRRGFMQLSASSALMLGVGASFASLSGCSKAPAASGYQVLRPADLELLSALAPVILSRSYPGSLGAQAGQERILASLDRLISTLQDYSQGQLLLLFDVLHNAPLRIAMGAPWASWSTLNLEQIEHFLQGWKTSRIQLKRMGYGSLIKLFVMCWYQQPETFASSGYPGMPKKIIEESL